MSYRVILASASPRRAELLSRLGLTFDVSPADCDEDGVLGEPRVIVAYLAEAKARAAWDRMGGGLVAIGADTIVVGRHRGVPVVLGKPEDPSEARRMLWSLVGTSHDVLTGVCVIGPDGATRVDVASTTVAFRDAPLAAIHHYVDTGESDDKAGAYGIQGEAAALVEWIRGDYWNVVGLPVGLLSSLLEPYCGSLPEVPVPSTPFPVLLAE